VNLSQPFADVLRAGRVQFNRKAAEARHRFASFDDSVFAAFLQTAADPIVAAVARGAPNRTTVVAAVAFELSLELAGQGLVGPTARSTSAQRV
jgi:hypothetical protein